MHPLITRVAARTPDASLTIRRSVMLPWIPAIIGFAFAITIFVVVMAGEHFVGDDLAAYLRAGDALRAGSPIYMGHVTNQLVFLYGPPWAVAFGAISLLPGQLVQLVIVALDLACLRYVAGSWRNVGYVFLYPGAVFAITSGNIDYLIAGALVLAWRSSAAPLAILAVAKVAPGLGLPLHRWREGALVGAVLFLMTLPWLYLWPEWIRFLIGQPTNAGLMLPIPWFVRLPFALALLIPRKPWASALAVVIATPGFYWTTAVLLLAPYRLWRDGDRAPAWTPRLPATILEGVRARIDDATAERVRERARRWRETLGAD
jgi:hypothetical protein